MARGYKRGRLSKRSIQVRREILASFPVCQICHLRASAEVDHIVPLARGGGDIHENCRAVCVQCHREKTKRDWAVKKTVDVNGNEIADVIARKRWGRWPSKRGRNKMTYGEKDG